MRAPAAAARPSTSRAWFRRTKSAASRVWGNRRRTRRFGRRGSRESRRRPDILLPVYYSWEFRTSDGGDFEELVRRLEPRELPPEVGKRPMDISHPGFALQPQPETGAPGTVIGLEGALRVVDTKSDVWTDATRVPFQAALAPDPQHAMEAGNDNGRVEIRSSPRRFTVPGTPACTWSHRAATPPRRYPWLNELNLDPRLRAAAAMGTEVVQAEQEALMASAWDQLGEAEAINQRLRQAQLSRAVNERYHTKAFVRFTAGRVHADRRRRRNHGSRLPPAEPGGQGAMLFAQQLARSFVPPAAVSPGARKLSRPRGAFNRRYTRAGDSGTQTLFTFFNQPGALGAFVVTPGNRGLCRDRRP